MRKVLSIMLAVAVAFSTVAVMPKTAKAATGTVTLSIEKLTIGQGLYGGPKQFTINSSDTVMSVIQKYMDNVGGGINEVYSVDAPNDKFLKDIFEADPTRKALIPNEIAGIQESYKFKFYTDKGVLREYDYNAPNTNVNLGNKDTSLGEADYGEMSGWVVTINNQAVYSGKTLDKMDGLESTDPSNRTIYKPFNQISVKNGDVIRVMFTLFGYGADVGIDTFQYTGIPTIQLADKTALLKSLGDINAKKKFWTVYPNVKAAYDSGMTVARTYNPTQASIDSATASIKAAVASPKNPVIAKATISKAVNVKGKKIKVTVKKITGVTGYQYKYGNNKKFKNKKKKKLYTTTIKTVKAVLTTKKIKKIKKKKAYVKVRAYKKVNGKVVYGKWSSVKTVKIKK